MYELFHRTRTIFTQHWSEINMAGASTVWHNNFGKEGWIASAKIKLYKERLWSDFQIEHRDAWPALFKASLKKKVTPKEIKLFWWKIFNLYTLILPFYQSSWFFWKQRLKEVQ